MFKITVDVIATDRDELKQKLAHIAGAAHYNSRENLPTIGEDGAGFCTDGVLSIEVIPADEKATA